MMCCMQSTDKKVNEITPVLFNDAPDAAFMAQLPVSRTLNPEAPQTYFELLHPLRPIPSSDCQGHCFSSLSQKLSLLDMTCPGQ